MAAQTRYSGIDPETGRSITGWPHVVACIRDILVTDIGLRPMREYYGSLVPRALGRQINRFEILPVISSISAAIEVWEPRFRVMSFEVGGDAIEGRLLLRLNGEYRPGALWGDLRSAEARTLAIGAGVGHLTIS